MARNTKKRSAKQTVQESKASGGDRSEDPKGQFKHIGGSRSDDWNNVLANQVAQALWLKHSGQGEQQKLMSAAIAGLIGIGPKDELEGMMAAQLLAAHNAAMECYRRAMIGEQSFEGRRENLTHANKLSRTYAALVEALNRHRGKGQQRRSPSSMSTFIRAGKPLSAWSPRRVTRGVGTSANSRNNPMQSNYPMHRSARCHARTRVGTPCQSPAMPNGRCRMHGGKAPGAPQGNSRAFKHGRYTAEAIAKRRHFAELLRGGMHASALADRQRSCSACQNARNRNARTAMRDTIAVGRALFRWIYCVS